MVILGITGGTNLIIIPITELSRNYLIVPCHAQAKLKATRPCRKDSHSLEFDKALRTAPTVWLRHLPRPTEPTHMRGLILLFLGASRALLLTHAPRSVRGAGISMRRRTGEISMLRDSYDLVVIGGGPVGVTAALRASSLGHESILIDATPPRQFQFTGPTGLFSKALRDSALRMDVRVLRSMGIGDSAIWEQVQEFVEKILRKSGTNNMGALSMARVPHLRGIGNVARDADGKVVVEVRFQQQNAKNQNVVLHAEHVLVATGSKAVRLPSLADWYDHELCEHVRCYDSDSILRLSFLPRSVVVIGGGIIAVEFARIFAALAADVTMVVRASDLPNSLARVGIDRQIGYALQVQTLIDEPQ